MRPAMRDPALAARLRALVADNSTYWMWLRRGKSLERPVASPALGRLGEVCAPTLLIVGAEDVPDIRRIVDTLAAGIPGARRVIYERTGHMVNMERPRRFTDDVLTFLRATLPVGAR